MEKQYDPNLDDSKNPLSNFLSNEGKEVSPIVKTELRNHTTGSTTTPEMDDNEAFQQSLTLEYKYMTGKSLRDMTWLWYWFLAAVLFFQIHNSPHKNDAVVSTALYDYYELQNDDSTLEDRTTDKPPLKDPNRARHVLHNRSNPYKGKHISIPIDSSSGKYNNSKEELHYSCNNQKDSIMLSEFKNMEFINNKECKTLEISTPDILVSKHNDLIVFDSMLVNFSNNVEEVSSNLKIASWHINKDRFNNSFGIAVKKDVESVCTSHFAKSNLKLKSRIVLTASSQTIKTNILFEKGDVIYLTAHGVLTSEGGIDIQPEGIHEKNLLSTGKRPEHINENYPLGALLFRFGNKDKWKPYLNSSPNTIAEKSGSLEFMVNLKNNHPEKFSGTYQIEVFTSQADNTIHSKN